MGDGTGKSPIFPNGGNGDGVTSKDGEGGNGTWNGASNVVGLQTDAITALNATLGGVTLLSQVVTYIQGAVVDISVARFHGIEDIASYTAAKKEEIDAQTTLAETSINEHAVSAIQTAIQNNMQIDCRMVYWNG